MQHLNYSGYLYYVENKRKKNIFSFLLKSLCIMIKNIFHCKLLLILIFFLFLFSQVREKGGGGIVFFFFFFPSYPLNSLKNMKDS